MMAAGLVSDPLRYWAQATPDDPAIVFDGTDQLTYAQLDAWTDETAHVLVASGLRIADRVGVVGANCLEWCVTALAAWKVGATVVPYNSRLRDFEMGYLIEDSDPALVVCEEQRRNDLSLPAGIGCLDFARIRNLRAPAMPLLRRPLPRLHIADDQPAVIVYTSGTTSRPKGVVYTHRTMISYIFEQTLMARAYHHGTRMLFALALGGAPGVHALTQMVTHGGVLFLERGFEPEVVLHRMQAERIQAFWGVPVLYDKISALPAFGAADLSSIEFAMIGSTRIQQQTVDKWMSKGVIPLRHYGMTELGGTSTMTTRQAALERPESVGRGGIYSEHRVVRPDGTDCAPDEPGEILVRGPAVTPGYWRNPEATAASLRDGWFHTGDIGAFDADGCLRFVDRKKDIIVSRGGHNIAPAEIEAVITELDTVDEVAVISVEDPDLGDIPVAVVGAATIATEQDIISRCGIRLTNYKIPRYVVFYGAPLPRNALGKVAKNELRAELATTAEVLQRRRPGMVSGPASTQPVGSA